MADPQTLKEIMSTTPPPGAQRNGQENGPIQASIPSDFEAQCKRRGLPLLHVRHRLFFNTL